MKVVGLTGGIGSGKTTVMEMFQKLGVPVYNADKEAKKLMHSSKEIRLKLIEVFGEKAYVDGKLNNTYLAEIVFTDKQKLNSINTIVHPVVIAHFLANKDHFKGPYLIFENAILFENGFDVLCDYVITVSASLEERIHRIQFRDKLTKEQILNRVKNQWTDQQKIENSDFVIQNEYLNSTEIKVIEIHQKLLKNIESINKLNSNS